MSEERRGSTATTSLSLTEELCGYAWVGDYKGVSRLLKAQPTIVSMRNMRGQTALYCASRQGQLRVAYRLLKEPDVEINTSQEKVNGSTPLHAAAYEGHLKLCALLLSRGADPTVKNRQGGTARDEARPMVLKLLNEFDIHGTRAANQYLPKYQQLEVTDAKVASMWESEYLSEFLLKNDMRHFFNIYDHLKPPSSTSGSSVLNSNSLIKSATWSVSETAKNLVELNSAPRSTLFQFLALPFSDPLFYLWDCNFFREHLLITLELFAKPSVLFSFVVNRIAQLIAPSSADLSGIKDDDAATLLLLDHVSKKSLVDLHMDFLKFWIRFDREYNGSGVFDVDEEVQKALQSFLKAAPAEAAQVKTMMLNQDEDDEEDFDEAFYLSLPLNEIEDEFDDDSSEDDRVLSRSVPVTGRSASVEPPRQSHRLSGRRNSESALPASSVLISPPLSPLTSISSATSHPDIDEFEGNHSVSTPSSPSSGRHKKPSSLLPKNFSFLAKRVNKRRKSAPKALKNTISTVGNSPSRRGARSRGTSPGSVNDSPSEGRSRSSSMRQLKNVQKEGASRSEAKRLFFFSASELAKELCLMEQEYFFRLKPKDFHHHNWMRSNAKELSPNMMNYIELSNKIGDWVTTEILTEPSPESIAAKVTFFIHVGLELLRLNNYNSLMLIVLAFQSSAISRLSSADSLLSSKLAKKKDELIEMMTPLYNYKNYKKQFATVTYGVPTIPLLPLLCHELFSLDEVYDDTLKNGDVNWDKLEMAGDRIYAYLSRRLKYNFEPNPDIRTYINAVEIWSGDSVVYAIAKLREQKKQLQTRDYTRLSSPERALLFALAVEHTYVADEIVHREGDEDDTIYFLAEGKIVSSARDSDVSAEFVSPTLLNTTSLFPLKDRRSRVCYKAAVSPTIVYSIPADYVRRIGELGVAVSPILLRFAARKLLSETFESVGVKDYPGVNLPFTYPFVNANVPTFSHTQSSKKLDPRVHAKFSETFPEVGEVAVLQTDCRVKQILYRPATLYLTTGNVCIESRLSNSVIKMKDITAVLVNSNQLSILTTKDKYSLRPSSTSTSSSGFVSFVNLLNIIWHHRKYQVLIEPPRHSYMSPQEWGGLMKGAESVKFKAGDVIVARGSKDKRLYQLASGAAVIEHQGKEVTALDEPLPIDSDKLPAHHTLFGLDSYFFETASEFTVRAKKDCVVFFLENYYITVLFQYEPSMAVRLYSTLGRVLEMQMREVKGQVLNDIDRNGFSSVSSSSAPDGKDGSVSQSGSGPAPLLSSGSGRLYSSMLTANIIDSDDLAPSTPSLSPPRPAASLDDSDLPSPPSDIPTTGGTRGRTGASGDAAKKRGRRRQRSHDVESGGSSEAGSNASSPPLSPGSSPSTQRRKPARSNSYREKRKSHRRVRSSGDLSLTPDKGENKEKRLGRRRSKSRGSVTQDASIDSTAQ
eukprot:TRINITY_DN2273_c0_g1_i1.p1 TRINITY_DN2273_c0_g1~~TRINITY_DN2273_c0_g1_i1.p1  ORF type:complete len:1435 (-),score=330.68 TRINITY_DN2273_c0_g1_i1:160-4464(-)